MKKPNDKKTKKEKIGLIKTAGIVVPYIIKTAPKLFIISCFVFILQTVLQSLQIFLLEDTFGGAAAFAEGKGNVGSFVFAICAFIATYIISLCLSPIANYVDTKFNQLSSNRQKLDMYEKMSRLEPIIFEDTDKLDDIEKANNGIDAARNFVSTAKQIFLSHIPYITVVAVYLVKREPLLMFAMLLIFMPTFFQQYMIKKLYRDKEDESAPIRRKKDYYSECMTSPQYYKETRNLGAVKFFIGRYRKISGELIKLDVKTANKKEIFYTLTTAVSLIGTLSVYYLLFLFLMNGRISVGEFAAVYSSIGIIEGRLHNLFYGSIGAISQELPNLENYIRFLRLPCERAPEKEIDQYAEIELKNVKFSYPNQEGFAVDGISFKISPRETVAIVGENGSGKSTLIKLITGYYVSCEGEVTYNCIPTSNMAFSSVAKHLSAVYQRYPSYATTLRENLILGDTEKDVTYEELTKACAMAGFTPDEAWLPSGLETMLSREFDDGVGLSGGQNQRISIARSFYRDSDIIVLDEPTAAIDPIEEARIYGRFAELSRGRTSFIVTHRLASVKVADRIIMMKNGKAIETGTHEELMELNGEYRRMFDSQRQWYEDDGE